MKTLMLWLIAAALSFCLSTAESIAATIDLTRAIEWVLREGATHTKEGQMFTVPTRLAEGLGMGAVEWPLRQKVFGPVDRPEITIAMQVAELGGRREIVVVRVDSERKIFWRTSPDGRVLATAVLIPKVSFDVVSNEMHAELFARVMRSLLEMLAEKAESR